MINKIATFTSLSGSRKILLIETVVLSAYTYFLFAIFNRHARFGNQTESRNTSRVPGKKIDDIAWAIKTTDRMVPWKNVCRHQAYQAKILCNFYKLPCLIFVGFKKDPQKNAIQAHAWTVAGEKIITGFCNPDEYIVQSIYRNKWS